MMKEMLNKRPRVLRRSRALVAFSVIVAAVCVGASARAAQRRDHLTPAEVDLVRDTQSLDKRTEVFIKAAERRVLLLTDPQAAQPKQGQKEKEKEKEKELWGELPKGTRAQLFSDLVGIFDEAITNIDDVAGRDENSPLLPRSLRKLGAAAARLAAQLAPMRESASDEERPQLDRALAELQEIVDAANKLPPPDPKEEKKSKDKKP